MHKKEFSFNVGGGALFVPVHQHGCRDVGCKPEIQATCISSLVSNYFYFLKLPIEIPARIK